MNIIKYLLSKAYRLKFSTEYTRELCWRMELEQKQMEEAFRFI